MVVFFMGFKMIGKIFNPGCQYSHLNFRRSGIFMISLELADLFLFLFVRNTQNFLLSF